MTLNGAIMQLVEMRENSMMPVVFKPYFDKVIETISECVEPSEIPHWIPCSERLPENDGELYLVTDYCKMINRKRIHLSRCYMNREGFWSEVPLGYEVIAWMPLPQPYKEDE